jgi:hypothetical protein
MTVLTDRDRDLLETLTCRAPMLAVRHIIEIWWPEASGRRAMHRRLEMLAKLRWIECYVVNAHPLLPVVRPLFAWKPGKSGPDCEQISQKSRTRWSMAALPTEVWIVSSATAALFGSTARRLPPSEHYDHDLRLASVYVHYRMIYPRLVKQWIGEHALPKAGYRIKDPDAFLRNQNGQVYRVIESAGRYSPSQVESFHEHCAEYDLPYELW